MKTTNGGGFTEIDDLVSDVTFSLHPNPAKDQLILSLKLSGIRSEVTIIDLLGTELLTLSLDTPDPIIDISFYLLVFISYTLKQIVVIP